jgi:hypothetical protein
MKSRLLVLNTLFAIMYTWYRLGWAGLGWIGWLVTKTSTNAKLGLSYLKLNIHGEKNLCKDSFGYSWTDPD